jgi:WD40 repeat protein
MSTPGTMLSIYRGHSERVATLAWSPDGRCIVSGSNDMTVQVWDAATGHHIYTYRGHAVALWDFVEAVAWSPNGRYIASGNDDWKTHVWTAPPAS